VRPDPPVVQQEGPDVVLAVHVQPRASRNRVVTKLPDRITVQVTAPPVEGAANAACCALVADCLDLPKSRLSILRGDTGRRKLIRIRNADAAHIRARLQST
jgi:uncharacterized protein (TIGR00251 family)